MQELLLVLDKKIMKRKILFSLVFISLVLSCDTSMDDLISTEDFLIGKWQLESYTVDGISPTDVSSCELLHTLDFTDNELIVNDYIESTGGLSCVLEESTTVDYFVKDNVIKTDYINFTIDEITISELHVTISVNDTETVIIKEIYKKIN